tara:strand:+ start:777 stop:2654 length:1878 start_codon:yes stop_codon:yes gene_type:complete
MSVEITTTSGISVTVTTPTNSSISVTSKGPKGDTGADSTVPGPTGPSGGPVGPTGPAGAAGTSFTAGDGLDLSGTSLTADLKYQGGLVINSGELQVNLSDPNTAGSLPVTKGGTGATSFTSDGVLFGNGAGSIQAVALTTNGNIIVGGADPAAVTGANLAGSGLAATIGNGTLVLDVETLNQDTTGSAATLTTPRAINGVDFDGSAAITVTAAGSTLSDTVTVAKGGTGLTTVAANTILTGNGTSALTAEANLTFNTSTLTIGASADIEPILYMFNDENQAVIGIANTADALVPTCADGDLVINSAGDHNVIIAQNNTAALTIDTDGAVALATDLAVAHGGTGASTLTADGVLFGNGTSAISAVDLSTNGNVIVGGSTPAAVTGANLAGSGLAATVGNGTLVLDVETLNQDTTGTAAIATTVTAADESSDTSCFPLFVTAATGNVSPKTGSNLAFNSSTGDLTAAGTITAKTFSHISCGYFDDISTYIHYLPLNGAPTEQGSEGNSYTDWIAPCAVTVLSVQLRFNSFYDDIDTDANLTMTVWKDPVGSFAKTSVESETVAVNVEDDNDIIHFLFDGASIAKGEAMKISIQSDVDITGNTNTFATVVLLMDWSDRYTVPSAVITS